MNNNLNPKQTRFVNEYLLDLNATAAAGRAGYSDPNYGRQLLTNSNVSEAIQERRNGLSKSLEITQGRVLDELACIAFFDLRRLFNPDDSFIPLRDLPKDVTRALSAIDIIEIFDRDGNGNKIVKYKYRFNDKVKALDKLSKHLGLYNKSIVIKYEEALIGLLELLPLKLRAELEERLAEKAKKGTIRQ